MSLIFIINDITIDNSDVKEFPKTAENISLGSVNKQLLPSELELTLDNIAGTYDDRTSTSIFFGTSWYNSELTIYDDTAEIYIWRGKVKTINLNAYNKTVVVRSTNLAQDIAETTIVYASTSATTPAEHIHDIITDVVGISESSIELQGFTEAINIQDAASVYADLTYVVADDKKCLPVITELCRMTQCELYTENNKIKLKQWQAYAGTLGELVEDKNLISDSSYAHYYDDTMIANSYNIKYDNADTIGEATGSDTTSITSFGTHYFNVPNESMDSTTSSEYKILLQSSTAAEWCGDLAIERYQSLLKYFVIQAGSELDSVKLNSQVDLSFDSMSREPGRIIEKNFSTESDRITFKGYFLNTPYQYYSRDTTAPEVPEIASALMLANGSIEVRYSQNFEADFIGYRLYFTSTAGEWEADISLKGMSPLDIKNPSTTLEGYNISYIVGLNVNTSYSVKIKSYDSSFNMSGFSNTVVVSSATYTTIDDNTDTPLTDEDGENLIARTV